MFTIFASIFSSLPCFYLFPNLCFDLIYNALYCMKDLRKLENKKISICVMEPKPGLLFHGKILKPISDVNFVNIANLSISNFCGIWKFIILSSILSTLNVYFIVPRAQKSNQISTNSMAISSLYFTHILISLAGPHRQPAHENK